MKIKSLLTFLFTVALTLTVNAKVWTAGDQVSSDAGNYIVKGENLLPNPYFENGFTGWTNGQGTELSADGKFELREEEGIFGKVLFGNGNNGSAGVGSVRSGIELVPGKTYLISYMEKNGGAWSRTMMASAVSTANDDNVIIPRNQNTADWSEKQAVVTVTEELPFVVFNFAWLNSANFAEFFVGEVESTGEVNYSVLEATIAKAKAFVDEVAPNVGDSNGNYSKDAYDTLCSYIADGEELIMNKASQEEVNAAVTRINEAMALLSKSIVFHYDEDFEFEEGVEYYIQQEATGYFLTADYYDGGKKGLLIREGFENADKIRFVKPEVEGVAGYYMVNQKGYYVYNSNGWDSDFVTEIPEEKAADPKYLFEIVNEDGHWVIKCVGNKYLATDGTWSWAPFYCDKGADNKNGFLRIASVVEKVKVDYSALRTAIEEARTIADENRDNLGDKNGNHTEESFARLVEMIERAEKLIADKASQEEVDAMVVMVQEAIMMFMDSIVFNGDEDLVFEPGVEYYIQQAVTGFFLSVDYYDNGKKGVITRQGFENADKIRFVKPEVEVEAGYYMVNQDDRYVYNSNGWDSDFVTEIPEDKAADPKYLFELLQVAGNWMIKCVGNKYLATDGTWSWAPFYCDKEPSNENGFLVVAKVDGGSGEGAVEAVDASCACEKVFYDLNGRRVNANNLVKGIYVVRQGGKASKIVVR